MFITRKHLSRRTMLRGMGVAVGAAVAGFHGAGADAAAQDGGGFAHRAWPPSKWCTARPAAPWKAAEALLVAGERRRGFRIHADPEPARALPRLPDDRQRHRPEQRGGACRRPKKAPITRARRAVFLTAAHPKMTEGSDILPGTSIDQIYAQKFGQDTPLPSIQLCIEDVGSLSGACGYGYSCVYANTISWASPTTPLPMEIDPRVAFERLFGDGGTAEGARSRADKPIAAFWTRSRASVARLQKDLGAERPPPPERLSGRCARDRAPHPEDREVQRERRGARAARRAGRRAGFLRRARQADVRPAGAGVHDGRHARLGLQDGPRREQPRLSRRAA